MSRILNIDDDGEFGESLASSLCSNFEVSLAAGTEGMKELTFEQSDVVLLDLRLDDSDDTNRDGLELLKRLKEKTPMLPVIMMTRYGEVDVAVEAMKLGADDFIQKDRISLPEYKKVIDNALSKVKLKKRVEYLEEELRRIEPWEFVGMDPSMEEIRRLIGMVGRDGYVTVLIQGETGTGKELVARAIHRQGRRAEQPFVPVCISSLNPSIVESELFGHKKGSFTGAVEERLGYFEKADGGVLFLDEIAELAPELQVKLLRFIEGKSLSRVGSTQTVKVDIQLVVASNQRLETAVETGQIRQDLYYRLKTMQINLPPLRERKVDIPVLCEHFLSLFHSQGRSHVESFSSEVISALKDYDWPGNVRELRASIERAVLFAENRGHGRIELDDLPYEIIRGVRSNNMRYVPDLSEQGAEIDEELARVELAYVESALEKCDEKKTEAWKLLGYTNRHAMLRRVKRAFETFPLLRKEFPRLDRLYPSVA